MRIKDKIASIASYLAQLLLSREPRPIRSFKRAFKRYYKKGVRFCCVYRAEELSPEFAETKARYLGRLTEVYNSNPDFQRDFNKIITEYGLYLFKSDSGFTLEAIMEDLAGIFDETIVGAAIREFCVGVPRNKGGDHFLPSEWQITYAKFIGVAQDVIDQMVLGNLERRLGTDESYVEMGLECAEEHASSNKLILDAVARFEARNKTWVRERGQQFHLSPDNSPEERELKLKLWDGNQEFVLFQEEIRKSSALIVNLRKRYGAHEAVLPARASSRKPPLLIPEDTTAEKPLLDIRAYEVFFAYSSLPLENIIGEPDLAELAQALTLGVFPPPPPTISTAARRAFRNRDHKGIISYFRKAVDICEAVTFVDQWATSYFYWTLAEAHKREGSLEESRNVLKRAIELFPDDYLSLRDLGHVSHRLGYYPTAIASSEREYNLASNGLKRFGWIPQFFEGLAMAQAAQNAASSHCRYGEVTGIGYDSTFDWLNRATDLVEWSPPERARQIAFSLHHLMRGEIEDGEFVGIRKDKKFLGYLRKIRPLDHKYRLFN